MKTLDEQIEYMKSDVDWYQTNVDGWENSLELCEAILKTLEQKRDDRDLRHEQEAKRPAWFGMGR